MSEAAPLIPRINLTNASDQWWRLGAIFIASGMVTGAFGTHGLKRREGITVDRLHAWETASQYAIFNGLALMLISLHSRFAANRFAAPAIAAGGAIFSGSIFGLVLGGGRLLGPLTPIGGTVMIAGYIALAL